MQKPDIESKINSKKIAWFIIEYFQHISGLNRKKLENNSAQTSTKTQFKLMK